MDKISYALGLSMGNNFIGSGVKDLNIDDFAEALRAVYTGGEKKMSYDEAKQIITEYFSNLEKTAAEYNAKAGKEYLEKNATAEGVKVTASGLQYQVVKEGTGAQPGPTMQLLFTTQAASSTAQCSTVPKAVSLPHSAWDRLYLDGSKDSSS